MSAVNPKGGTRNCPALLSGLRELQWELMNLLSVGANSGAVPWNGFIDEGRFSDTFSSDSSTRTLWPFDDAACASSFADSSGNGDTLTGQNGAKTGVQGASTLVNGCEKVKRS